MQITRNLLAAALQDIANQRFITVSESCVPLYPPQVLYSQLMYNPKSMINACTTRQDWSTDGYRHVYSAAIPWLHLKSLVRWARLISTLSVYSEDVGQLQNFESKLLYIVDYLNGSFSVPPFHTPIKDIVEEDSATRLLADYMYNRWTWRLWEITGGRLKQDMWRKNHQWLGVTRKHAHLIVDDTEIAEAHFNYSLNYCKLCRLVGHCISINQMPSM